MPFEQAREQISERVFTDKRKDEFEKYLQKLRAQAIIEWKNAEVKKAYDEGAEAADGRDGRTRSRVATCEPDARRGDVRLAIRTRALSTIESRPRQWFAVWTRSRHEQVVREQLERKRIDAFLPTITRWSRWKDRKKKIDWPLFPGYCFARFDPRGHAADPEVHGRRQHRLVRGQARADSRVRARQHPPAGRQRAAVRPVSDDPRRA